MAKHTLSAIAFPVPLRPGNDKTGTLIYTTSLPPGKTCPGMTADCWRECYARKGHYNGPTVINRLALNDAMRHAPNFIGRVTGQIVSQGIQAVRVHAAGDFDTEVYIQKWIDIAKRNPDTVFYAYTRSWSVAHLLPLLRKLARQPNFEMWFSCDKSTGMPPRSAQVRRAYMACTDTDTPRYKVDLFFRAGSRKKKMVKMANTMVCPAERTPTKGVTCAQCKLCLGRGDWLDQQNARLRGQAGKATGLPVLQGGA